jgi:glutamate-ammonia-ligase adenylyltransferase
MSQPELVYEQLQQFKHASQIKSVTANGRQRLDTLMPVLLSLLVKEKDPPEVLNRVLTLVQSVLRRSVYLSLLNEYPHVIQQLVKLCAASPWIAHLLSRYPVLLDELLDSRSLYENPSRLQLHQELDDLLRQVADDEEQQIERLRKFKQAQVLKIAAMDIAGVLDVFAVSEQLSSIAEVLLDKVIDLAWGWMLAKYGKPVCVIDGETYYPSLGVIAYGKLGGKELSYSSDLDLVFVHDSQGELQQTDGERCLDNATFFARLAQRVIHLLSVQTANGRLYEVDMRLRPDGNAGMLVSSTTAFDIYQHEKAWTWEHQALIRARMVCSSAHLKEEFDRIRRSVLMRPRERQQLANEVVEMRNKMRETLGSKPGAGQFHLKQDAGGLVDIEFIAQYGALLCAAEHESVLRSTATRKILLKLSDCGVLSAQQADALFQAYRQYRELSHQLALQEHSSKIDESQLSETRQQVQAIWQDVLQQHAATDRA